MIEPLLMTTARVSTFDGKRPLTCASGFFFERDGRLFLVTSRHVVIDTPSKHFPDRIEVELHTDAVNLTLSTGVSVLLYLDGKSVWRQGNDTGGEIDVAVIELDRLLHRVLHTARVRRTRVQHQTQRHAGGTGGDDEQRDLRQGVVSGAEERRHPRRGAFSANLCAPSTEVFAQ